MQGTFSDIIYASWEWTKTVLFRPFKLKKWILLCVIALLSAEFSGCNLNLNLPTSKSNQPVVQESQTSSAVIDNSVSNNNAKEENSSTEKYKNIFKKHIVAIIILSASFFLIFLFFFMWIYARFNFVFINSMVNNDASIKRPFSENKLLGNSYFKWNMLLTLIGLCSFALLILILIGGVFIFKGVGIITGVLLACVWSIALLCLILVFVVIGVIVHDLMLPVMYKQKITIKQAYRLVAPMLKQEATDIAKYLLIKLALRMVVGIAAAFAAIAIMFALLIPIGILFGLLYAASLIMPHYIQLGYYILLIGLGMICLFAIILFINIILLPVPVFFRTFSLKFLSRLDERYNVFKLA